MFTIQDYQVFAMGRLRPGPEGPEAEIARSALGLSKEVGSLLGEVKDQLYCGKHAAAAREPLAEQIAPVAEAGLEEAVKRDRLLKEAGDTLFFLATLLGLHGLSLGQAADYNRDDLERRFPQGPSGPKLSTVKVGGKPFRCVCGANVFRNPAPGSYFCNACGAEYASIS